VKAGSENVFLRTNATCQERTGIIFPAMCGTFQENMECTDSRSPRCLAGAIFGAKVAF
jgi:hypothetical protein